MWRDVAFMSTVLSAVVLAYLSAASSAPSATLLVLTVSPASADIVHSTVERIHGEGELAGACLSPRDIAALDPALTRALQAMYHHRVSYPAVQPSHAHAGSGHTSTPSRS